MSNHENALPKAVQDQISQADEIYKSVYEQGEKTEEETPERDEKPSDTEEAQADPTEREQKPKEQPKEDGFEHKFNVLRGKYDKEVPRLHRQLREAQNKNAELAEEITSLKAMVQGMKTADPEPEPDLPPITDEERDQFGPDLIDLIRRVAHAETGVVLDKQLKPIKQSVEQVNESVAKTSESVALSQREQMLEDLEKAVPNWREQNEDEDFLEWLEDDDPYSGKKRAELLADALKANHAPRVIALFEGFQKENAVVTPSDQHSEAPAEEDKPKDTGKEKQEQPDELNELVAPGTPKTGSTGAQNESGKKIWNQREIKEFYAYKNEFIKKNPERDLPEEVVKQERDLFKAQAEGRIRG